MAPLLEAEDVSDRYGQVKTEALHEGSMTVGE